MGLARGLPNLGKSVWNRAQTSDPLVYDTERNLSVLGTPARTGWMRPICRSYGVDLTETKTAAPWLAVQERPIRMSRTKKTRRRTKGLRLIVIILNIITIANIVPLWAEGALGSRNPLKTPWVDWIAVFDRR